MKHLPVLMVAMVVALTACGGGGGGGGVSSSGPLPPLTITSSNYADVATNSVARANGASSASQQGTILVGVQIAQSESIALKNIALSTASSATVRTLTLAMPNFLGTSNADSFSFTGFSMTVSENGSSASLNMAGTISSSRYGGSVVISTPTTLDIDPSRRVTGEILFTGKNGTKARIIGQRSTSILIEADTTGNGTYDTKTVATLASLGL